MIMLGGYSYRAEDTHIARGVTIGQYCAIANLCTIGAQQHNYKKFTSYGFREEDKNNTIIGHDVWIGSNSVVMSGVTIGTGAVIGSGSVVTHDVPPYAIVYGAPAIVHEYRFLPDVIRALLASKWWELPIEIVSKLPDDPMAAITEIERISHEAHNESPQGNPDI